MFAESIILDKEQEIQILRMTEGKRKFWVGHSSLCGTLILMATSYMLEALPHIVIDPEKFPFRIQVKGPRVGCFHFGITGHIRKDCDIYKSTWSKEVKKQTKKTLITRRLKQKKRQRKLNSR